MYPYRPSPTNDEYVGGITPKQTNTPEFWENQYLALCRLCSAIGLHPLPGILDIISPMKNEKARAAIKIVCMG